MLIMIIPKHRLRFYHDFEKNHLNYATVCISLKKPLKIFAEKITISVWFHWNMIYKQFIIQWSNMFDYCVSDLQNYIQFGFLTWSLDLIIDRNNHQFFSIYSYLSCFDEKNAIVSWIVLKYLICRDRNTNFQCRIIMSISLHAHCKSRKRS